MAIELATQFQSYTDEQFTSESKTSLVTNKDFSFDGAKTIKLYKMQSTEMEDFNRNGPILDGNKSQYGTISTLQGTIRLLLLWSLTALLTAAPAVIHPLVIAGLKKSNRPFCSWQILTSA